MIWISEGVKQYNSFNPSYSGSISVIAWHRRTVLPAWVSILLILEVSRWSASLESGDVHQTVSILLILEVSRWYPVPARSSPSRLGFNPSYSGSISVIPDAKTLQRLKTVSILLILEVSRWSNLPVWMNKGEVGFNPSYAGCVWLISTAGCSFCYRRVSILLMLDVSGWSITWSDYKR